MEVLEFISEKWYKLSDKIRFLFVGGVNAAISYIIFAISVFILGEEHYQASVILQWSLSSVFSYLNQKFLVFGTKGNYIKEYLKCCSTWAISYILNVIILELLVRFAIKNNKKLVTSKNSIKVFSTFLLMEYYQHFYHL